MKIKLNTYKILFRLLDILSNSKLLHKMVINQKIYLGASIISLSLANSGCSSSKMNARKDTSKNNQNDNVSSNNNDSINLNIDTIKYVSVCYISVETSSISDDSKNRLKEQIPLSIIDPNGENIARINDLASIIWRPKGTEKLSGTVFVEFTITADGIIKDVRINKGANPFLDSQAIKIIRNLHRWFWPVNFTTGYDILCIVPIQFLSNEH